MKTSKFLHEFSQKFSETLPSSLQALKIEFEAALREGLSLAISKLSLIPREEFETQTKVLAKTRAKVEQLEQRLTQLEKEINGIL